MEPKDGFPGAEENAVRVLGLCQTAKADLIRQASLTAAVYKTEGSAAAGACGAVLSGLTQKELAETDPERVAVLRQRIARMNELIGQLSEFCMMAN